MTNIRLFTVPNMLTLANLICGVVASVILIERGDYPLVFALILLASLFDFLDGAVARLLGEVSPMGVQLDSLSDMVSFGLLPSLIMCSLVRETTPFAEWGEWGSWGYYVPLVIVAMSALRLAKFNIEGVHNDQEFTGLPTPASALLCGSLGLLYSQGVLSIPSEVIAVIAVVVALLLIAPIQMFSLKFKGFDWRSNWVRYIFLLISALLFLICPFGAMSITIVLYIAISVLLATIKSRKL